MKNKNSTTLLTMLALLVFMRTLARAENFSSPSEVVNQFCLVDFSGARLQTMGTDPIWRLTTGDGEPPDDPIVLVKGWRIIKETPVGSGTDVEVSYDLIGDVTGQDGSLVFTPSTLEKFQVFHLSQQRKGWKIQLETLKVSPHISVASERYHLGELAQMITAAPPIETLKLHAIQCILKQLEAYGKIGI